MHNNIDGRRVSLRVDRSRRLRTIRTLSLGAGISACLALIAGPAHLVAAEGTEHATYAATAIGAPGPRPRALFGSRMVAAGDLNGDRVNDVFIASTNRVDAFDGAALGKGQTHILYTLTAPPNTSQFGGYISVIGDVDGDGVNDVVIGANTNGDPSKPSFIGIAFVYSGANGRLLYRIDDPNPQQFGQFAGRIGRAGDVNGDGIPDIIISASAVDVPTGCRRQNPQPPGCTGAQGKVYIYSGNPADHRGAKTGLIRTLDMPAEDIPPGGCTDRCRFGLSVQGPGDVDGDGVPDVVVDAGYYNNLRGRMYVFSGADGHLIRKIDSPEPQEGAFFGFQDATPLSPGDVNHDGHADIYGASFSQDGPAGPEQGKAWVFDGATGAVLYALNDPTPEPGGLFGFTMATTRGNLTGDEDHGKVSDIYVGQAPHHPVLVDGQTRFGGGNGGTFVFGGKDGRLRHALELPSQFRQTGDFSNLAPALGWSIAALGDLNGDGIDDYVAGAPFEDVGPNRDQGIVLAFLSQEGSSD